MTHRAVGAGRGGLWGTALRWNGQSGGFVVRGSARVRVGRSGGTGA